MTRYKKINLLLPASLLFLCVAQIACKKSNGFNDVVSDDKTKPGIVTNVQVHNFNGGAFITYDLPASPNILYVQAEYKINDAISRQTKSSYYSDTVRVDGFAKSQDYKVTLYVVSRAEVKSDPVEVTVHPNTPPYLLARQRLKMETDFGGVHISTINEFKADIGVITITPDRNNKLSIIRQEYTSADTIDFSIRGYDTSPRQFGVYITDRWNNVSDTLLMTISPLYETQMQKSRFATYVLPSDVKVYDDYRGVKNLWDNNINEPTYNTQQPITPLVWPAWVTFDMGQEARLSRYTMVGRTGDNQPGEFLWGFGTPQTWVIWGRASTPVDEQMPDANNIPAVGAVTPNGWINLGYFTAPRKPSGLPNPNFTNADLTFWRNGFEFNFSLTLPKVRYIRFECLSNMGGTNNFFDINELTFFGDTR